MARLVHQLVHQLVLALVLVLADSGAYAQGDGAEPPADAPAAPAQLVWLPPADAQAICTPATFNKFTKHNPSCAKALYFVENPGLDCCEGLADWYGPNSTRASRNCWCDADAWAAISSLASAAYSDLPTTLDMCAHMGHPVGANNGDGQGWCYGLPPDPEALAAARVVQADKEMLDAAFWDATAAYFKKVHQDSMVTFATVSSVFAGVGVMLLVWPLLVDSVVSASNLWSDIWAIWA